MPTEARPDEHKYPGATSVHDNDGVLFARYAGVDAFIADAMRDPRTFNNGHGLDRKLADGASVELGFRGVSSVREAMRLASEGWADGAQRVRDAVPETTVPRVRTSQRRQRWADDGDDFDRARFLADREDCYRVARREAGTSGMPRTARLVVRVCANSSSSERDWLWSGAAAIAWADALETAGVRVRLDFVAHGKSCHTSRRETGWLVTLKDYDMPIQPERVAFWTAHAASFRVIGFRWLLSAGAATGGLGSSLPTPEALIGDEPGTILVPRLDSSQAAQDWLALVARELCDPVAAY